MGQGSRQTPYLRELGKRLVSQHWDMPQQLVTAIPASAHGERRKIWSAVDQVCPLGRKVNYWPGEMSG